MFEIKLCNLNTTYVRLFCVVFMFACLMKMKVQMNVLSHLDKISASFNNSLPPNTMYFAPLFFKNIPQYTLLSLLAQTGWLQMTVACETFFYYTFIAILLKIK